MPVDNMLPDVGALPVAGTFLDGILIPIILIVITTALTTTISFYIKDKIQKGREYKRLKYKLETVSGKNSQILFSPTNTPSDMHIFTIDQYDRNGIVIKNEMQTIFIPIKKLLESEIIIPTPHYEEEKLKLQKKEMENIADTLYPIMMGQMKNWVFDELLEDSGEINHVIGAKIQKQLADEGYEVKRKPLISKTPGN